ncbi:membrane integrity-associated transporter subunit PqiC [Vreelandella aquamarina]|uniref:PqiC family protein n=1 Tax=Vreelandella aquamarina TaxID=77097 RepID=UPI003850E8C4
MLRRLPLLLLFIGLSTLLAACASSVSPPARYMLPAGPAVSAPDNPQDTLQVRSPRLAHYLDVDGIVMQLDDITLNEAREHQWAESIGRQLERALRAQLAERLPTVQVVRAEGNSPEALTLSMEIDQFQGRYDGVAVASGQWQLRGPNNELLALKSFTAESTLNQDGYPALVRSLGDSWNAVAQQIAEQLRQGGYF